MNRTIDAYYVIEAMSISCEDNPDSHMRFRSVHIHKFIDSDTPCVSVGEEPPLYTLVFSIVPIIDGMYVKAGSASLDLRFEDLGPRIQSKLQCLRLAGTSIEGLGTVFADRYVLQYPKTAEGYEEFLQDVRPIYLGVLWDYDSLSSYAKNHMDDFEKREGTKA